MVLVRDPRDVVISYFHYLKREGSNHFMHPFLCDLSTDAAMNAICNGVKGKLLPVWDIFDNYASWGVECGALVLKYEDLVSQERRFSTLKNLYSYLGVPLSDSAIDTIGARVVDRSSRTFRKGIVGSYKQSPQCAC